MPGISPPPTGLSTTFNRPLEAFELSRELVQLGQPYLVRHPIELKHSGKRTPRDLHWTRRAKPPGPLRLVWAATAAYGSPRCADADPRRNESRPHQRAPDKPFSLVQWAYLGSKGAGPPRQIARVYRHYRQEGWWPRPGGSALRVASGGGSIRVRRPRAVQHPLISTKVARFSLPSDGGEAGRSRSSRTVNGRQMGASRG